LDALLFILPAFCFDEIGHGTVRLSKFGLGFWWTGHGGHRFGDWEVVSMSHGSLGVAMEFDFFISH
jgi:hypothetical protein